MMNKYTTVKFVGTKTQNVCCADHQAGELKCVCVCVRVCVRVRVRVCKKEKDLAF